jgi:hypothetical protein
VKYSIFCYGIQREYGTKNTEYSYKLLTFKAIPEVGYGSLPMMGKAENMNSISATSC